MKDLLSQTAFVFYGIGVGAMLIHALKKWLDGEVKGKLIDWYIKSPKRTAGAILACLGSIVGLILGGIINDYNVGSQIVAVAGAGFAADTLNGQGKQQ